MHVDLTFTAPTTPLSVNATSNWAKRKRLLDPWKDAARVTARNHLVRAGRFRPGADYVPTPVTVQVVLPFRKRARRDAHNYTGTVVKWVVDGLVHAGIVPDDDPTWVTVMDPEFSIVPDKAKPLTATIRIRPREA